MSYVTKQFITAFKLSDTSKFKKTNCSKVERYIKHSKYKRKHGWTNLKKIVIVIVGFNNSFSKSVISVV